MITNNQFIILRAAICDNCKFDRVSQLPLPHTLKAFLRDYSYKHKIRTRQLVAGAAGGGEEAAAAAVGANATSKDT